MIFLLLLKMMTMTMMELYEAVFTEVSFWKQPKKIQ